MLQSIEGVYKHGSIELSEIPENIDESRVIVTFLEAQPKKQAEQIVGTSGQQLLSLAGTISPDDLELISKTIKEDCEQINLNDW
jgi:hypothetical protein